MSCSIWWRYPLRSANELGRDLMGPEEGRHDVDGEGVADFAGNLEAADLRLDIEPIARLDLDGGGAVLEHRRRPAHRRREQLIERCPPGGSHRRGDAAPGLLDIEI